MVIEIAEQIYKGWSSTVWIDIIRQVTLFWQHWSRLLYLTSLFFSFLPLSLLFSELKNPRLRNVQLSWGTWLPSSGLWLPGWLIKLVLPALLLWRILSTLQLISLLVLGFSSLLHALVNVTAMTPRNGLSTPAFQELLAVTRQCCWTSRSRTQWMTPINGIQSAVAWQVKLRLWKPLLEALHASQSLHSPRVPIRLDCGVAQVQLCRTAPVRARLC
jgi:hypothetical protein